METITNIISNQNLLGLAAPPDRKAYSFPFSTPVCHPTDASMTDPQPVPDDPKTQGKSLCQQFCNECKEDFL